MAKIKSNSYVLCKQTISCVDRRAFTDYIISVMVQTMLILRWIKLDYIIPQKLMKTLTLLFLKHLSPKRVSSPQAVSL